MYGVAFSNSCKWTIYVEEIWQHFNAFGSLVKGDIKCKVRYLIWMASTGSIWRLRNNLCFRGDLPNVSQTFDHIIYFSWNWFVGCVGINTFFYWCSNSFSLFFCVVIL